MIRALFLTPAYPPFPGGGERYVRSLAEYLAALGVQITIFTSSASHEHDFWQGTTDQLSGWNQADNLTIVRQPLRPFPGGRMALMGWRKLMVLLSALPGDQSHILEPMARLIPPLQDADTALQALAPEFDLVHGFNISWEYPLLAGWRYARQHNLPFVATPFMHFGTGHDRVARNSTMDHQRQMLQQAQQLLVLTQNEQAGLEQLGLPPKRITVIGGGLDPLPPLGDTAALRRQAQLVNPYAIFIGRNSVEKGAIHAAQAVLTLVQQGVAVQLALVGQSTPEFDNFFATLSPSEQQWIRPLGLLDDRDKHTLLSAATALLLPSRTDSFGIVILEAWAHGVPVIAARAGGIPGVVDEGKNGLLHPFGDVPALSASLRRLLTYPDLRHRLGKHGQEKVTAVYSWQHVAERVYYQYRQLVSG